METRTIPVVPAPVIPPEPIIPNLVDSLPPVVYFTADEALAYQDACAMWREVDAEGNPTFTQEQIYLEFPGMTPTVACDWIIRGRFLNDSLTMESIEVQKTAYVEALRAYVQSLKEIITSMYELTRRQQEAILGSSRTR